MIEIAIQDIQKYDLSSILNRAMHHESVIINHDGQKFLLTPLQQASLQKESVQSVADDWSEFFKAIKVETMPNDFKFDREEANERR